MKPRRSHLLVIWKLSYQFSFRAHCVHKWHGQSSLLAINYSSTPIQKPYLTNREALTVLCSVVKHAGSGQSTKEVQGETRDVVECFSPLLESRLLYLFYNKESVKLPKHYFQFSKQTLFPKRTTMSSACSILS